MGLRGATVARLTPDQKAACSNHVGVNNIFFHQTSIIDGMFHYINSLLVNQYPGFLSVVVITSALHAVGRRFEPGRKHVDFWAFLMYLRSLANLTMQPPVSTSFLSVVVITSALHAVGRRFEPGRKHLYFLHPILLLPQECFNASYFQLGSGQDTKPW